VPDIDLGLPLERTDFHERPILLANHFVVPWQSDEFVLSVSRWAGRPLVGTPDEQLAGARSIGGLPVLTPARVSLDRRRTVELLCERSELLEGSPGTRRRGLEGGAVRRRRRAGRAGSEAVVRQRGGGARSWWAPVLRQ
jgi:hypothetical protein